MSDDLIMLMYVISPRHLIQDLNGRLPRDWGAELAWYAELKRRYDTYGTWRIPVFDTDDV